MDVTNKPMKLLRYTTIQRTQIIHFGVYLVLTYRFFRQIKDFINPYKWLGDIYVGSWCVPTKINIPKGP